MAQSQYNQENAMVPDACWRCKTPVVVMNPTFYSCGSYPYCRMQRSRDDCFQGKQNGKIVHLEIKDSQLELFSLYVNPDTPYLEGWMNAIQKQFENSGLQVIRASSLEILIPLADYEKVKRRLLNMKRPLQVRTIPTGTLEFARCYSGTAQINGWFGEDEVCQRFDALPAFAKKNLFPYQEEAVRYAIRRGGKVLIGDEMGTGKTFQALCVAQAFREDWPLLVVCPASLRRQWAAEAERWCPFLRPGDLSVIYSKDDRLDSENHRPPITIISYHMLRNLTDDAKGAMKGWNWKVVICDESHTLNTQLKDEAAIVTSTLRVIERADRRILCSGTPALAKPFSILNQVRSIIPGLLAVDEADPRYKKQQFAYDYCQAKKVLSGTFRGKNQFRPVVSGVCYAEELHHVLKASCMVRRLKSEVLKHLPPKLRTTVVVEPARELTRKDLDRIEKNRNGQRGIQEEEGETSIWGCYREVDDEGGEDLEVSDEETSEEPKIDGSQEQDEGDGYFDDTGEEQGRSEAMDIGMRKADKAGEWILDLIAGSDEDKKVVVFAHHLAVLDKLQEKLSDGLEKQRQQAAGDDDRDEGEPWQPLVRLDGSVPVQVREAQLERFKGGGPRAPRLALVSVTAGGQGIQLQAADTAVFAELPPNSVWLRQAEDRLHRQGQAKVVNVYYLVAPPGTYDHNRWQAMCREIDRTSQVTNAPDAKQTLDVDLAVDARGGEGAAHSVGRALRHEADAARAQAHRAAAAAAAAAAAPPRAPPGGGGGGGGGSEGKLGLPAWAAGPPRDLHFLVSPHTGRVHFYGSAAAGSHLGFNLEPYEVLAAARALGTGDRSGARRPDEAVRAFFRSAREVREAARLVREYQALRPRHQALLHGWPLRPPLLLALELVQRRRADGLTGSRARVGHPDLSGLSQRARGGALAPGERLEAREVTVPAGARRATYRVVVAADGRGQLCLVCPRPVRRPAAEQRALRDLCCSAVPCYENCTVRVRQSAARAVVWRRDGGVCEFCGLSTVDILSRLAAAAGPKRRRALLRRWDPRYADPQFRAHLCKVARAPRAGLLWEADHVIEVSDGGGECSADNLRTLCYICHRDKTKIAARDRARQRQIQKDRKNASHKIMEKFLGVKKKAKTSSREEKGNVMESKVRCNEVFIIEDSDDGNDVEVKNSPSKLRSPALPSQPAMIDLLSDEDEDGVTSNEASLDEEGQLQQKMKEAEKQENAHRQHGKKQQSQQNGEKVRSSSSNLATRGSYGNRRGELEADFSFSMSPISPSFTEILTKKTKRSIDDFQQEEKTSLREQKKKQHTIITKNSSRSHGVGTDGESSSEDDDLLGFSIFALSNKKKGP